MLTPIRIFLKVVEAGSFSRASTILNMAPSSVARSIDTLEKDLNCALFERSTRSLRLTEKGNLFLEGASKLIEDADQLRKAVNNENVEPEGMLRISVFESFGRLYVCPVIPEFLQRYPGVSIEVDLENKMLDLMTDNIDIAIRIGEPADSQLKVRTLLSNHTVICATPDYLAQHGTPTVPEDLDMHNCLILNQGRQRTYWHFKKKRQHKKVLVRGNLKSQGGTPLLSAALQGTGIVQLSNWMVADFIKNGELTTCLDDWTPGLNEHSSGNIYIAYKASKYPRPLIRLFIDHLVEKTSDRAL